MVDLVVLSFPQVSSMYWHVDLKYLKTLCLTWFSNAFCHLLHHRQPLMGKVNEAHASNFNLSLHDSTRSIPQKHSWRLVGKRLMLAQSLVMNYGEGKGEGGGLGGGSQLHRLNVNLIKEQGLFKYSSKSVISRTTTSSAPIVSRYVWSFRKVHRQS